MTNNIHKPNETSYARDGNYEGYLEHSFRFAFQELCGLAGGYENGKKLALEIMEEQAKK